MNDNDNPLLTKKITMDEVIQRLKDHYDYKKSCEIPFAQCYTVRVIVNNQILEEMINALSEPKS
jgi:hypothetical protein